MLTLGRTLLTLLLISVAASLSASPVGYSINSDSQTSNADSLYRIDLGTSPPTETRIATVKSQGQTHIDVEGLAFAPDGTLYAVDDDTLTLFPISPVNAAVDTAREVLIKNLPIGGANDFGMTFACDGSLYVTSVAKQSLYRLDLNGNVSVIGGAEGRLNTAKIIALAAWGDRLYGLGNGATENGDPDTPNLYEIDLVGVNAGKAVLVGALDGAGPYLQGGMSFDDAGNLWAITEGAQFDWPSQLLSIDTATGMATNVNTLVENGFESLAIAIPGGCQNGAVVSNTKGVPALDLFSLAVAAVLLLLTGLFAARRF